MKQSHQEFYICKHCGNLVGLIHNSGAHVICCGENMTELVPNNSDASSEKHVPVIHVDGNTVRIDVGSAPHPMTQEHYTSWVYIMTENGGQRKILEANEVPSVEFKLTDDDKLKLAFAYCNVHGLWMAKV